MYIRSGLLSDSSGSLQPAPLVVLFLSRHRRYSGSKHSTLSEFRRYVTYIHLHSSVWSFYVPLFGTLINLGVLYWKRHSHPLNLVLLSTFTLMEAFTLGVVVAFYDNIIVIQAL